MDNNIDTNPQKPQYKHTQTQKHQPTLIYSDKLTHMKNKQKQINTNTHTHMHTQAHTNISTHTQTHTIKHYCT